MSAAADLVRQSAAVLAEAIAVGEGAGSKAAKAEQLGVPIIPAERFDVLLADGPDAARS